MSILDIGTPGAPMSTPPLTAWQAAVRDALDSSDVSVNERINDQSASVMCTMASGWTVGADFANMQAVRSGPAVSVFGMAVRTDPLVAGGWMQIATVPSGYLCRPQHSVMGVGAVYTAAAGYAINIVTYVSYNGGVHMFATGALAMAAGDAAYVNLSYRGYS